MLKPCRGVEVSFKGNRGCLLLSGREESVCSVASVVSLVTL